MSCWLHCCKLMIKARGSHNKRRTTWSLWQWILGLRHFPWLLIREEPGFALPSWRNANNTGGIYANQKSSRPLRLAWMHIHPHRRCAVADVALETLVTLSVVNVAMETLTEIWGCTGNRRHYVCTSSQHFNQILTCKANRKTKFQLVFT